MRKLGRSSKISRREQQLVFAAIALFVVCAVSLPVLLAVLSSRPDLYAAKPKPVRPGIAVVDWKTLDSLLSGPASPAAGRPDWFGPEVEIAGYMIPAESPQGKGNVAHFLLVPDPGDWLNPPHMHPGEVIDVRMRDGCTTQLLERTAVTVIGMLSYGSMNANSRVVLVLTGATVEIK